MAKVLLSGVFMGKTVKESEFNGNKKTTLLIDVYQPDSEEADKMVQVRTNELTYLNHLDKDYDLGSTFSCEATVNAYKNVAYYNLQKIV